MSTATHSVRKRVKKGDSHHNVWLKHKHTKTTERNAARKGKD